MKYVRQDLHEFVRRKALAHVCAHADEFASFFETGAAEFGEYVNMMAQGKTCVHRPTAGRLR